MPKDEVREVIQERVRKQRVSWAKVGEFADLPADTIYGQVKSNRFQKADWPRLADALNRLLHTDLPTAPEKLEHDYVVNWAKHRGRDAKLKTTFEEEQIWKLYRDLGEGDGFAFSSLDEEPMEYSDQPMRTAVADAVRNGAVLIYIRPADELLRRLTEFGTRPEVQVDFDDEPPSEKEDYVELLNVLGQLKTHPELLITEAAPANSEARRDYVELRQQLLEAGPEELDKWAALRQEFVQSNESSEDLSRVRRLVAKVVTAPDRERARFIRLLTRPPYGIAAEVVINLPLQALYDIAKDRDADRYQVDVKQSQIDRFLATRERLHEAYESGEDVETIRLKNFILTNDTNPPTEKELDKEELLQLYQRAYLSHKQTVPLDEEQLTRRFERFRRQVRDELKKDLGEKEAERLVSDRMIQVFADGGGFFTLKEAKALFLRSTHEAKMTERFVASNVRIAADDKDQIRLYRRFVAGSLRQYLKRLTLEIKKLQASSDDLGSAYNERERIVEVLKGCLAIGF